MSELPMHFEPADENEISLQSMSAPVSMSSQSQSQSQSPRTDKSSAKLLSPSTSSTSSASSASSLSSASPSSPSSSITEHPLFYVWVLTFSGFAMSFKPSEPFLTNYLIDVKGFTNEEVSDLIYPWWTYTYLLALLPIGIVAELLSHRSKPATSHATAVPTQGNFGYILMVLVGFLARFATRVILIYGESLLSMQMMQVTFGIASATEPIFYTLLYTTVPLKLFPIVSIYLRVGILSGHLFAGLLGQILIDHHVSMIVLFYISWIAVSCGMLTFIVLAWLGIKPKNMQEQEEPEQAQTQTEAVSNTPQRTENIPLVQMDQHARAEDEQTTMVSASSSPASSAVSRSSSTEQLPMVPWFAMFRLYGLKALLKALVQLFLQSRVLLYWSIWVWFGNSCLELVLNYNTSLFYSINSGIDENGYIVAAGRGFAALTSYFPKIAFFHPTVQSMTSLTDLSLLTAIDAVSATLLYLSTVFASIYAAYVFFIVFYGFMQYLCSLAAINISLELFHIAKEKQQQSRATDSSNDLTTSSSAPPPLIVHYSLLFTFNQFISLCTQSFLQFLLGHQWLHVDMFIKFKVFAYELYGVTFIFFIMLLYLISQRWNQASLSNFSPVAALQNRWTKLCFIYAAEQQAKQLAATDAALSAVHIDGEAVSTDGDERMVMDPETSTAASFTLGTFEHHSKGSRSQKYKPIQTKSSPTFSSQSAQSQALRQSLLLDHNETN